MSVTLALNAGMRPYAEEAPAAKLLPARPPKTPAFEHFVHLSSLFSVLVVIAHSFHPGYASVGTPSVKAWQFVDGVFAAVRMPVFFFVAGFVFLYTNPVTREVGYFKLMRRKVGRLLMPYLFLTALTFPIKAALSGASIRPVEFSVLGFVHSLFDAQLTPIIYFWFILALFSIFTIAPFLRKVALTDNYLLIALVTAATLIVRWFVAPHLPSFMAINAAGTSLYFFWVGMLAWKWHSWWTRKLYRPIALLGVCAAIICSAWGRIPYTGWIVAMPIIYAAYYAVAIYLERGWQFLHFFEGKSYTIYLLSWFPQQFVVIVLNEVLHWDIWLCVAMSIVLGLSIPLLIARFVEIYLPALQPLIGLRAKKAAAPRAVPAEDSADGLGMRIRSVLARRST